MSAARAKGTLAERLVANYLTTVGWPYAERRAMAGSNDRGDITGTPGIVWEIKSGARLSLPEWMRETEQERKNAGAHTGVLVVKPRGMGAAQVGEWWSVMPLRVTARLLAVDEGIYETEPN